MSQTRTRLYYRYRTILVTSRHVQVGPNRYDVADLDRLMRARGPVHPGALVGGITSVVEAALLVPVLTVFREPALWPLAVVALVVPVAVGFACARRWPAPYQLLARYRGRQILLYATRDRHEFGRVSRAIMRAVNS